MRSIFSRVFNSLLKQHKCALIMALAALFASGSAVANDSLNVYAASSLSNVVEPLFDDFQQRYPERSSVKLVPVFAGSSALARQVTHGAPADLVMLANSKWMDYLVEGKWVSSDNVTNLTSNQLVVIAPKKGSENSALLPFDLLDTQHWLAHLDGFRLAMGNPQSVPAGIYAKEALQHAGVWTQLSRQIAPTNNVRVALTLVERAEAPLGIVYSTDARYSNEVEMVANIPEHWHQAIRYPVALRSESEVAKAFFAYLQSESAQQILHEFGFGGTKSMSNLIAVTEESHFE